MTDFERDEALEFLLQRIEGLQEDIDDLQGRISEVEANQEAPE